MNKAVIYKFILLRTKELICDDMSRPRFMASFDRIVNDLFGVPKFSRKIANSYDNRDVCAIVDLVGVENLIKIYDNNYYYSVINELVMVDYQIRMTCKELSKQKKNDSKQRKNLMKKKNYLIDLYRKALKHLRKLLGIKNAETAYKRNFQLLNGLVKQRDYDDFGFELGFDDPYDDDYTFGNSFNGFDRRFADDYDSTSPLEDFVREMNGNPTRRTPMQEQQPNRRRFRKASLNDFDFDPYDDYDPSGKYDRENDSDGEDEDRIDRLTETVSDLSSVVNALVNQKEYDIANPQRGPRTLDEVDAMYDNQDHTDNDEWKEKILKSMQAVDENQKMLAGALGSVIRWKEDVDDVLQMFVDVQNQDTTGAQEDDDGPEFIYGKADILPKKESETREDMINQINHNEVPVAGTPID